MKHFTDVVHQLVNRGVISDLVLLKLFGQVIRVGEAYSFILIKLIGIKFISHNIAQVNLHRKTEGIKLKVSSLTALHNLFIKNPKCIFFFFECQSSPQTQCDVVLELFLQDPLPSDIWIVVFILEINFFRVYNYFNFIPDLSVVGFHAKKSIII